MDTIPAEGSGDRVRHLPAGRRSDLAQFVAENGQVTVALLAERYGVSIDTIRRDLDQLDADGVLVRTHGGAVSGTSRPPIDRGLDVRLRMQPEEKEAIAERAAGLVEDGSVIIINAGTCGCRPSSPRRSSATCTSSAARSAPSPNPPRVR
jgi:DeoR family fructose operon transcriptional repressor